MSKKDKRYMRRNCGQVSYERGYIGGNTTWSTTQNACIEDDAA